MHVPVILGTSREGRQSEKAARYVLEQAKKFGFESELIDTRDYPITATDKTLTTAKSKAFAKKITAADALIIVAPEYNHGYPGELKLLLDMLYDEYADKPVGICGVSIGAMGGCRAVEQLRQVVIELRMLPIREALYFPNVKELFDDNGQIKDSAYEKRAQKFFGQLKTIAER